MSPESSYIRTYLETVVELPWGKYGKSDLGLDKAEKILEARVAGIPEVHR